MWELEESLRRERGYTAIAGTDEAGAGPLAGRVYAAAVILPFGLELPYLNDSKKVTPKRRDVLFDRIREAAVAWAIAYVEPEEIDRIEVDILFLDLLVLRLARAFVIACTTVDVDTDAILTHDIIDDIVIVEIRQITVLEAVERLLKRLDVEATVLDEAVNAVHLILGDRIITECVIDIGLADGVLVLLRLLAERFDLLDELLLADFRLFVHLLFGGLLIRCFLSGHTTLLFYIPWR